MWRAQLSFNYKFPELMVSLIMESLNGRVWHECNPRIKLNLNVGLNTFQRYFDIFSI